MKIIGLTGNIGSGKTLVAQFFKKNSYVINADEVGHKTLNDKKYAYGEIVDYFGDEILDYNKLIDRKKLSEIVFNDKVKLKMLTKITHKYIIKKILDEIKLIKEDEKGKYDFIIIDAPLLIEANIHLSCDVVIVVTSNIKDRVERIIKRDGVTKDFALKKIKNQKSTKELESFADIIIKNESTIEKLREKVENIIERLKGYEKS